MIEKHEKEVSCYFNECAQQGIMESFSSEEVLKLKTALELWNIQPGQRILEPGCGSGRLTEYLARAVDTKGEVYACDISGEMIRCARKRNLPDNVTFLCGSVNSVPKDNYYFDKVICLAVFPHFSDQALSLTEIARVLQPGGDLWIEHFKSRETINTFHKNASDVIVSHIIPPDEEMYRLLTKSGFEVEGIWDSPEGYRVHAIRKKFRIPGFRFNVLGFRFYIYYNYNPYFSIHYSLSIPIFHLRTTSYIHILVSNSE